MKVRVPLMVQDPTVAEYKGMPVVEGFDIKDEPFFLDGPVTKRVAVLNFDTQTGALHPGVRFQPPERGKVLGKYTLANDKDYAAADFNQVSVFGTVLKTMYMFEEPDALGRPLIWGFGAPQLLVVPRAGEWENAFYERESHSLQFFYFTRGGNTIYTSLSRDVVAHETGHAILDGIAPDLYACSTPQALALHEAIADLTALVVAFGSHTLRETVLDQTDCRIDDLNAFSSMAEEFGRAVDPAGSASFLRSLNNTKSLLADARAKDRVDAVEPHDLSEVASGALFRVMIGIYDELRKTVDPCGKALAIAAERFQRMVFRALDYLPPGEVSFADFGRAIIAADQASHPNDKSERKALAAEFVKRGIVGSETELTVDTNFETPALADVNLDTLTRSDWAAYEFANKNRALFGIPDGRPIWVRSRLAVEKLYYHRGQDGQPRQEKVKECIFKVSWDLVEDNPVPGLPSKRQITVGTTLAIDWDKKLVRARLISDAARVTTQAAEELRGHRDRFLARLADEGILCVEERAMGPLGRQFRSVVRAEATDGLMRVRGTARALHIVRV